MFLKRNFTITRLFDFIKDLGFKVSVFLIPIRVKFRNYK